MPLTSLLYRIGFLGFLRLVPAGDLDAGRMRPRDGLRKIDDQSKRRAVWMYEEPDFVLDPSALASCVGVVVHPAFRKALNI